MPLPISTGRLLLRAMHGGDVASLARYRSDPQTARYQGWAAPYPTAAAEQLIADSATSSWPVLGRWVQLAIEVDGRLAGDIGVYRSADGRHGQLGYTLDREFRGRGLATEAVGAVVDLLFAEGVEDLTAGVDPANSASARLLHRLGFEFQGRVSGSLLSAGDPVDDDQYLLRALARGARASAGRRPASGQNDSMSESHTPAVSADPTALLDLATRAARAAGAELLRRYGHVEGLDTKSSDTDPVSDADRAAERLLVQMISAERPHDAVIGEEGADRPGGSGYTWVLDPLDGTVNYLYQLGNFAVSVAVQDNGDAADAGGDAAGRGGGLVGVVFDPVTDRTFTAIRGCGAFLNGRPLRVNDPVPMRRAMVATGFGYEPRRRAVQGEFVARLLPHIRDIRRFGSAALDLCSVAAGAVDCYFEEGINHWDHAAGGLIAREAGATMTTFTPTGQDRGWLAAGPSLHAAMTEFAVTLRN
jgi:myo-inositol-1(or 4)-monophosphatase